VSPGRAQNRRAQLSDVEIPDVEISTSAGARAVRFGIVPQTSVWFDGEPGVRSSSVSERENLPDEIEPGVTYRDIRVRWQAGARIDHPTDPAPD
jgi:hypothetical protein